MTCSDSLDAVPFPTEIRSTLYFLISFFSSALDSSTLFCGAVGKITFVSSTFPVGSTIASLQPVRKAGSHPRTVFPAIGGCMRSCSRFLPKTVMALSSAFSVSSFLISRSMAGAIRRSYASFVISSITGFVTGLSFFSVFLFRYIRICSSGAVIFTFKNFSASPLFSASTRCPSTFLTGSSYA